MSIEAVLEELQFILDIMRKPDFCICKNKDAVTAQLICIFVFASMIVQALSFLNPLFKLLAFLCDCRGWFVLDLVWNTQFQFSHIMAHDCGHLTVTTVTDSTNVTVLIGRFASM